MEKKAVYLEKIKIGYGIKPNTYFKLMYIIYTGSVDYSITHIAIFGVN